MIRHNFTFLAAIFRLGERCYTPNNSYGLCVVLPQCPSLVNFYGQNQNNPQAIQYLLISQRNCGTRSIRRNPLVCCSDPYINHPQPFPRPQPQPVDPEPVDPDPVEEIPPEVTTSTTERTTPRTTQTTPPTTTTTTTRQTTQSPIPDSTSRLTEESCRDPNGLEGVCKSIRECPTILSEFVARNKDSAYVQYIQRSNVNCRKIQPFICCPFENQPKKPSDREEASEQTDPSIQGRFLTPEEGCGFSNVTHRRIVGGQTAKPHAFPWMALIGYTNNLGEQSWKCGGSLITTRHVLTAAHCVTSTLYVQWIKTSLTKTQTIKTKTKLDFIRV